MSPAVNVSGVFQFPSSSSPLPSQFATLSASHSRATSLVHDPSGSPKAATIEVMPSSRSPEASNVTLNDIPAEGSSLVESEGAYSPKFKLASEPPTRKRDNTARANADVNATRLFIICTPIA